MIHLPSPPFCFRGLLPPLDSKGEDMTFYMNFNLILRISKSYPLSDVNYVCKRLCVSDIYI